MESFPRGRIDFPGHIGDFGPTSYGHVHLSFKNTTDHDILMSLWTQGSSVSREVIFPPSNGWQYIKLDQTLERNQTSLLATGDTDGLSIRGIYYSWGMDCSQGCGGGEAYRGSCPGNPLPGMAALEPVAPRILYVSYSGRLSETDLTTDFLAAVFDSNLEALTYEWDFGDGSTGYGPEATHTFKKAGRYSVQLKVTDPAGLSDQFSRLVVIKAESPGNEPPVAKVTTDRNRVIRPHTIVNASAEGSFDPDGDSLSYEWINDSGRVFSTTNKVQLDADKELERGEWLWVSDELGNLSNTKPNLYVKDAPKNGNCRIKLMNPDLDSNFRLDVELFNNSALPITNWQAAWRYDSSIEITEVKPQAYLGVKMSSEIDSGDSNITTVTISGDENELDIPPYSWVSFNLYGESQSPLHDIGFFSPVGDLSCVENHVPVAVMTATPVPGTNPLLVSFSAEGSYDLNDDELSYIWKFGDGTESRGKTAEHYFRPGDSHLEWAGSRWANHPRVHLIVQDDLNSDVVSTEIENSGSVDIFCRPSLSEMDESTIAVRVHIESGDWLKTAYPKHLELSLSKPATVIRGEGLAIGENIQTTTLNFPLDNLNLALGEDGFHSVNFVATTNDSDKAIDTYITNCSVR